MKNKYVFVLLMLLTIIVVSMGLTTIYVNKNKTEENDDLIVVTSFYPMYIAGLNVVDGIEGVTLTNLSEPQTGCLHDFQLTPADMKLLSTADVFIINGGGIESFMEEVAEAYPDLEIIEACDDIELIEDEEEENAHAWMSIESYRQQVENISNGLGRIDEKNKANYRNNYVAYDQKLSTLSEDMEQIKKAATGKEVILFHEAFAYVAKDCGLEVAYVMDLDEERQISAGEVADVLSAIKDNGVSVILAEELYGKDMGDTVEKESDVKTVYIDPLNRGDYDKDSYLNGMQANIDLLRQTFNK